MSPSIPILFALLLTLISGSAEGGLGTDPVALLRQTLRYWRKIYNTYHEEVTLGYCWADYLLQISVELSTNPSGSLSATGDRSNTTTGATKSQRNPFPENVMADATPSGETLREHLRKKRSHATARSTISEFMKDPNGHRIATEWKISTGKRERRPTNEAGQGVAASDAQEAADKADGDEKIAEMTDPRAGRRRRALSVDARSKLPPQGEREPPLAHCHEFSSGGTSSRAVNPTSDPRDDDEVDSGAPRDHDVEEDVRRKVLRPATTGHRGLSAGSTNLPRSFSLSAVRGRRRRSPRTRRFRLRRCSPSRERNSRVSELLSAPKGHRGTRTCDPEGRQVPSNNDEGPSMRPQFQPVGSGGRRVGVVKSMDSGGNSSRGPLINSGIPRQKRRQLSRDSLLSARGRRVSLEYQESESGKETIKKNLQQLRTERLGAGDAGERRRYRPSGEKGSRRGRRRNLSLAHRTIHPGSGGADGFPLGFKNCRPSRAPNIPRESRDDERKLRIATGNALSSVRVKRHSKFHRDRENNSTSSSGSAQNSQTALENTEQRSLDPPNSLAHGIRAVVIGVLRTLGMFVQVGRQIMDIVDSHAVLACTREYLWTKTVRWIDM